MINYAGEEIKFTGCPGCAYAKHEFKLPCGIAYQDDMLTVSQDWELPIDGFFVVCPTARHVERFTDLTTEERARMFELVDKVMAVLKDNKICDLFNIVIQEKPGVHLHVWIYPQYDWMKEKFKNTMGYVKDIFDYAKENLRTKANLEKIKQTSDIVRKVLNEEIHE